MAMDPEVTVSGKFSRISGRDWQTPYTCNRFRPILNSPILVTIQETCLLFWIRPYLNSPADNEGGKSGNKIGTKIAMYIYTRILSHKLPIIYHFIFRNNMKTVTVLSTIIWSRMLYTWTCEVKIKNEEFH